MSDTLGLPARRKLPDDVRERLRAEVREGIAHRRSSRTRYVAAAAAVVVLAAGAVVATQAIRHQPVAGPAPRAPARGMGPAVHDGPERGFAGRGDRRRQADVLRDHRRRTRRGRCSRRTTTRWSSAATATGSPCARPSPTTGGRGRRGPAPSPVPRGAGVHLERGHAGPSPDGARESPPSVRRGLPATAAKAIVGFGSGTSTEADVVGDEVHVTARDARGAVVYDGSLPLV